MISKSQKKRLAIQYTEDMFYRRQVMKAKWVATLARFSELTTVMACLADDAACYLWNDRGRVITINCLVERRAALRPGTGDD